MCLRGFLNSKLIGVSALRYFLCQVGSTAQERSVQDETDDSGRRIWVSFRALSNYSYTSRDHYTTINV